MRPDKSDLQLVTRSEPPPYPAIAQHTARTPIVVVLGMHRSGTSLCAQVLSLLGLDMADEIRASPGNEAGHWERWEIVDFHDRVLRSLDRDYWSGTHDFPLPIGWWAQPEVRAIQRELEDFVRTRMRPGHPFGFKDPRTARLLPLWTPIFRALNLDPRFVFCVRSPSQVARSLNDRDGLPLATGEYRWAVYNTECWRNLRTEPCTIVYDSWFTDRDQTLDRLLTFLSDVVDVDRAAIAEALETRIDRSLRHDGLTPPSARQPALRYFYELLGRPDKNAETQAAIARFTEQFAAFQQFLPFEGTVKAAAEREAALSAADERVRALQDAEAQHAADRANLHAALDEARNEAHAARNDSEVLRAQHAAAVQERDAALADAERYMADVATTRAECEGWRAQHAAVVQARDEATAAAEAARSECEGWRAQHAAVVQARDEATTEAEAARSECEGWRAQHAAVAQARDEAMAAAEAARSECDGWPAQHAAAVQARDEAMAAAEAARSECEGWRAQHAAAVQARDEATAAAEAARLEHEALEARHGAAISEAEAEIQRQRDARLRLQQWAVALHDGIASSWSWRLTRPLRRAGFARAVVPPHPDPIDP